MSEQTQFELTDPPSDGITNVCFSPDSKNLLVSSWDSSLRLYDVDNNRLVQSFNNKQALLDCCFGEGTNAFASGLDCKIKMYDLATQVEKEVGSHSEAVPCIRWSPDTRSLYSASWDKTLSVWDPQSSTQHTKVELPHKAFSMDLKNNTLAVAMADRHIYVYDIRNMSTPYQERESSLRYMLRAIQLMPNGQGFACSSIEGRVAFEYFDLTPEIQQKKYNFKSHRAIVNETEVVYPVNALAFHPGYGTFATGGSDCVVNIWDGAHRKRLRHFPNYPEEISSLAFSHDGSKLAIASSYVYDEGERDHAPDAIFIKYIDDADVRPKVVI